MSLKGKILNNIGLKILALAFSIATWFYVGESSKAARKEYLEKLFYKKRYISKKLYVKPIFVGKLPDGYIFSEEQVTVTPTWVVVSGPSELLLNKKYVYTIPIDLGEHTRTKTIEVPLRDISSKLPLEGITVKIGIKIDKINEEVS